jgi:hypothetical protein
MYLILNPPSYPLISIKLADKINRTLTISSTADGHYAARPVSDLCVFFPFFVAFAPAVPGSQPDADKDISL